jgi:hypothetical protein
MSDDRPPQPDPLFSTALREISRNQIAEIWRRGQHEEPLSEEDQSFYAAMLAHPEYHEVWQQAAELSGQEVQIGGMNPFLHIALHSVIERQVVAHGPPEVAQSLFRLTCAGLDRHEAVHLIASVWIELMGQTLREQQPFPLETYRRRLRALRP